MGLYVLSDLHIQGSGDPMFQSLLAVINQRAQKGDVVVLAGDLFDLFVGGKKVFKEKYSDFFRALIDAGNRGVKICYIEGNHDFLIKRVFRNISGLTVHSDFVDLEIGGRKFYFAHGDRVDSSDYSYRILRFFFRSFIMKTLVALFPAEILERIGKLSSRKSREKNNILFNRNPQLERMDRMDQMQKVRRVFRSYAADLLAKKYDFVVLGHCHDLDEMNFNIGNKKGQYINVGFPRIHGSFLSWSQGDEKIQREKLPT